MVNPDELAGFKKLADAVRAAGMLALVVAPSGGTLPNGMAIQRTFGATRSVEFDAVVLVGSPAPAADAIAARDSKAAEGTGPGLDPRVALLLQECFRHAKAIGAMGAGAAALAEAGVPEDAPGVVTGGAQRTRSSLKSMPCSAHTGSGSVSARHCPDARYPPSR